MADELEKQEEKKGNNPTGKGGFIDHPENINKEGRPKNQFSITHWAREFLNGYEPGHSKSRAQELAEKIVSMAYKDGNVALIKELLNRVEGTNPIRFDMERNDVKAILAKIYAEENDEDETQTENNTSDTGDSK